MLSQNTSFYLVLVVLRNLNVIAARNKSNVVEDAVKSLEVRLQQQLGNTAITGRWTSNQFIAILGSAPSNAITLSRDVSRSSWSHTPSKIRTARAHSRSRYPPERWTIGPGPTC